MELALTVFGVIFAALAAPIAVLIAFILVLSALNAFEGLQKMYRYME